jgi:hypothetical protein
MKIKARLCRVMPLVDRLGHVRLGLGRLGHDRPG